MASITYTFTPIPANHVVRVNSTTLYTVPSGYFAQLHAFISGVASGSVQINGTAAISASSTPHGGLTISNVWLDEGDTVANGSASSDIGFTATEFNKG